VSPTSHSGSRTHATIVYAAWSPDCDVDPPSTNVIHIYTESNYALTARDVDGGAIPTARRCDDHERGAKPELTVTLAPDDTNRSVSGSPASISRRRNGPSPRCLSDATYAAPCPRSPRQPNELPAKSRYAARRADHAGGYQHPSPTRTWPGGQACYTCDSPRRPGRGRPHPLLEQRPIRIAAGRERPAGADAPRDDRRRTGAAVP
jgi:hypothetical protein